MRKIYNYTFQLVIVYILVLSLLSISNFELTVTNYNVSNSNNDKTLDSKFLVVNKDDVTLDESINEVESNSTLENEIKTNLEEVKENIIEKSNIDISSFPVLSTEKVTISHYGHDCYGCTSGYTASGYYVGDGRIYYQDSEFGNVRVVAADNKYPMGTIIRLEYHDSNIIAIVLDRGGGIGDGKRFQIDLLESSEQVANSQGIFSNSKLEVLRLGY